MREKMEFIRTAFESHIMRVSIGLIKTKSYDSVLGTFIPISIIDEIKRTGKRVLIGHSERVYYVRDFYPSRFASDGEYHYICDVEVYNVAHDKDYELLTSLLTSMEMLTILNSSNE